jgi:hypothetical protein
MCSFDSFFFFFFNGLFDSETICSNEKEERRK